MKVFRVEYHTIEEIKEHYCLIHPLFPLQVFPECIIVESDPSFALMLHHDINIQVSDQNYTQTLVRCYVIKDNGDQIPMMLSDVLERYRLS